MPRAGLLRMPPATGQARAPTRMTALLAERGVRTVSYADWLRIEAAEQELAASLGRGARVKLSSREDLHRACGLPQEDLEAGPDED